jgi:hypothetical protein
MRTLDRLVPGLLLVVAGAVSGCGQKPSLPTEEEARAAFYKRDDKIKRIEEALKKEIAEARLSIAPPACVPPDDACLAVLRARDQAISAGQKRLLAVVTEQGVACAEIVVSSRARATEVLATRVDTCPPGKRGDSIAPTDREKGKTLGDYVVGRGVYFKGDNVMHPGIALHREMQDGDAATKIDIYFFTDS